ncbi:MAG: 6-pyruvoyl-tetrahydropterin synthase-related protein [Kiritimatiellae bacterium]|jgi:hypothetical protein|nr:6-pyruvoyl-tetrahydropterin synthase-related protein [Kiritimatiellia bacterium]
MKKFLLLILILTQNVFGGYIALETSTSSTLRDKTEFDISSKLLNKGNEPAIKIYQELTLEDQTISTDVIKLLPSNSAIYLKATFNNLHLGKGRYYIIIKSHYSDINNYPFSAISSIPMLTAIPDELPLFEPTSIESEIKKNGIVNITLNAQSDELPQTGKISLYVPHNLEASPTIEISDGNWPETVSFEITNITGLPNSSFIYEAIIEYDYKGFHESISCDGIIKLIPSKLSLMKVQIICSILFLAIGIVFTVLSKIKASSFQKTFILLTIVVVLGFIIYHLAPEYMFLNTTPTGGDIPAHNYMVKHLKEQLFSSFPFKITSWAPGWWCGFPLFQFYFPLGYLLMALLSFVIPINIAFKIIMVIGLPALPLTCFFAFRRSGLKPQTALLAAILTIPFIFDSSNTMWGANIYSTLAGMISNSISFALFILTLSFMSKDIADAKIRKSSILLLCLLISSHFFTSIMAALMVAIMPFLFPNKKLYRSFLTAIAEGLLALGLMSWWILPVLLKRDHFVDFGLNWDVNILTQLPLSFKIMVIPALASIFIPNKSREQWRLVCIYSWMLICGTFLFLFGFSIKPIFVNVRLWPFMTFPLCMLTAITIGQLLSLNNKKYINYTIIAVVATICVILPDNPGLAKAMANGNFIGLEGLPYYDVIEKLVLPLDKTPGRLANDLHPDNTILGSSRVFETVPALIDKPILEGGIVNSAIGSYYSYYVQSETSDNCAGFPPLVKPTTFNIDNATKHLELFNVKHFIARSPRTIKALDRHRDWTAITDKDGWHLYELTSHDGSYIFTPKYQPIFVNTSNWKENSLDWLYEIRALEQPFAFVKDNTHNAISEEQFYDILQEISNNEASYYESQKLLPTANIETIEHTSSKFVFKTDQIGLPHIIKMSYFPNWKVKGAKAVYMVSPDFMLIYPEQETVTLYYGKTTVDIIAYIITSISVCMAIFLVLKKKKR